MLARGGSTGRSVVASWERWRDDRAACPKVRREVGLVGGAVKAAAKQGACGPLQGMRLCAKLLLGLPSRGARLLGLPPSDVRLLETCDPAGASSSVSNNSEL